METFSDSNLLQTQNKKPQQVGGRQNKRTELTEEQKQEIKETFDLFDSE